MPPGHQTKYELSRAKGPLYKTNRIIIQSTQALQHEVSKSLDSVSFGPSLHFHKVRHVFEHKTHGAVLAVTPQLQFVRTMHQIYPFSHLSTVGQGTRSEQPDVDEEHAHRGKKAQPDLPADARPLGHQEHAVHGALQSMPCHLEAVVHLLCQRRRVADLVAHGYCQLVMRSVVSLVS